MSEFDLPMRPRPPSQEWLLATRVSRAAIAVPLLAVSVGASASVIDLRFGLFATAVVIGWTQLVGL